MKNLFTVSVSINILLIGLVLMVRECATNCPDIPSMADTVTMVTHTTDTLTLEGKTEYFPVPFVVYDTFRDTVYRTYADTLDALRDYQLLRNYRLALFDDTNGKIDVLANIQFNKIQSWRYEGKVYNHQTTIERNHYVMEKPRAKLFAGLGIGYQIPEEKMQLAPSLALLTKKEHLYSASYDPFTNTAQLGIYFKIQLKK